MFKYERIICYWKRLIEQAINVECESKYSIGVKVSLIHYNTYAYVDTLFMQVCNNRIFHSNIMKQLKFDQIYLLT